MKIFDCSELQRGMIFHIQDRDRGFVFIGRVRFSGLDFIQFDVLPTKEQPSCKTLGMYTFNIGSKFTLHGVKWNDEQKEYVYDESIITSEHFEKDVEFTKGDRNMKLDSWKDFVIKDVSWFVNDQIKNGDTIYRIKTDYVDIKGKMKINNVDGPRISIEFDRMTSIYKNITIMIVPEMRIFKTDSENDPGILLQDHKDIFNPELCVGKLYWITNSDLEFKYLTHVKSITDKTIEVHIINTVKELNNTSSLTVTGKSFDIQEVLEYKFKEV